MPKEIGPREKAAREMREALYESNQARMRAMTKAEKILALDKAVGIASLKRGKPRKAKKK